MPLRDHFRPPVSKRVSWEGFHDGWPMAIVQHLDELLPPRYVAEPRVHLGSEVVVDFAAFEEDAPPSRREDRGADGGVAAAAWPATEPIVTVETELPDEYEYAVRIYDVERERTLVAALEIVSPANKDRPEKRNTFVGRCAAFLKQGVAVSIVDLVMARRFNLFAELMAFIGHAGLAGGEDRPAVYAASCRWVPRGKKNYLEVCARPLVVGQPLPTIPLWLATTWCCRSTWSRPTSRPAALCGSVTLMARSPIDWRRAIDYCTRD